MKFGWRWAALKNGFQDATAYRWEFLIEVIGSAFAPAAIQWILWYAMFKVGGATQVAGMGYEDMIRYTLMSTLFTQIRGGNLDFELQDMIRTGSLSQYMLRPVSVLEFLYIRGSAPKFMLAGFCLVVGIGAGLFFGLSPVNLLLGMLMALAGNIIHYQISTALAATAFLWEEAFSVLMVKNLIVQILSGELLPLNLFPESMSWLWKYTPFHLFVYAPVRIAEGAWSTEETLAHFGMAVTWFFVGWAIMRGAWALGMRRYLSLGG